MREADRFDRRVGRARPDQRRDRERREQVNPHRRERRPTHASLSTERCRHNRKAPFGFNVQPPRSVTPLWDREPVFEEESRALGAPGPPIAGARARRSAAPAEGARSKSSTPIRRGRTTAARSKTPRPRKHYSLMSQEALARLPVRDIMAKRAALFLWATGPRLHLALELVAALGPAFSRRPLRLGKNQSARRDHSRTGRPADVHQADDRVRPRPRRRCRRAVRFRCAISRRLKSCCIHARSTAANPRSFGR